MPRLFRAFCAAFLTFASLSGPTAADVPQIGFAHRVNDWDEIKPALSAGVNGIEIDICWGGGAFRSDDWYVSHNDSNVCANPSAEHLDEWLERLRTELNANSTYRNRLVALWIDIKDLSDHGKLYKAVDIVHAARLPSDLRVIYDLTGYSADAVKGFNKIHWRMRANEGISMCAGKSCEGSFDTVKEIYDLYKSNRFTRGGFNTGDSLNIDERFLTQANKPEYNQLMDPYSFKFVHTWTNRYESSMEDYTKQSRSYRTTGQIVGEFGTQWRGYMSYIAKNFQDAVRDTANVKFAVKSDKIFEPYDGGDFGRLASVWVDGSCIDVKGSTARNGQNLELRPCDGGAYQSWAIRNGGIIRLHASTRKCIDPEGPSYSMDTPLQIWDCIQGYRYHNWTYHHLDKTLRPSSAEGMCAGLTGNIRFGTLPVTLQPCDGSDRQKWYFSR